MEDTDIERSLEGAEKEIYEDLLWCNLMPDESPYKPGKYGPYCQSQRIKIYKQHADYLLSQNDSYYCFCTKENSMKPKSVPKQDLEIDDCTCNHFTQEQVQLNMNKKRPYCIKFKVNKKIIYMQILINIDF